MELAGLGKLASDNHELCIAYQYRVLSSWWIGEDNTYTRQRSHINNYSIPIYFLIAESRDFNHILQCDSAIIVYQDQRTRFLRIVCRW